MGRAAQGTTGPTWPTHIYILTGVVCESEGTTAQVLLSNEHGRKESVEQVRQVLAQCQAGTLVEIIPVSIDTQGHVIEALRQKRLAGEHLAVVNLCDGTELDGYPGVSVVNSLQKCRIPYSGSDAEFYEGTTSKPVLKRKLIANNVATSPFVEIRPGAEIDDIQACEQIMSWPMIIKPSISYASMNISDKSVVHSREEALAQTKAMIAAAPDGVFVESFLGGREFTALCTGDARVGVKVYPIAERVFNAILKHEQRILAFDRYWDGYDLDGSKPPPDAPSLYWYDRAPADWQEELQDLARRAYIACGGNGYGRVDIRTRSLHKPDAFVLEVNANCGLSFGAGSSSLGEILHLAGTPPTDFCRSLIEFALIRST